MVLGSTQSLTEMSTRNISWYMDIPCHVHAVPMPRCAVALKNHFQNCMAVAWYRRVTGAACHFLIKHDSTV
jgi:hypothetical protein